ncbi:MAG: hypothetical protein ACJ8CB_20870, partial [Ktedonobacteraceae bacterium]
RYQRRRMTLLKRRGGLAIDHPEPVATTWSLSFEKVEKTNPAAADLLRLCALLHPDSVLEEIIVNGAPYLGSPLHFISDDPFELDKAIGILSNYSLIRRNITNNTLTIHPLVGAMLVEGMNQKTLKKWAERVVRATIAAYYFLGRSSSTRSKLLQSHLGTCIILSKRYGVAVDVVEQLFEGILPASSSLSEETEGNDDYQKKEGEFWETIKGLLPSSREQRLAYLLYYCGLKPRQVVDYWPDEFSNVHEVYRLQRNIMKRFLRSDLFR